MKTSRALTTAGLTSASLTATRETTSEGFELRRVEFSGDSSLSAIPAQHGCEASATVGLWPFIVDDAFVTLLVSASPHLQSAELLFRLQAAVVRQLRAPELLLAFQFTQSRHTVYMDSTLAGAR